MFVRFGGTRIYVRLLQIIWPQVAYKSTTFILLKVNIF